MKAKSKTKAQIERIASLLPGGIPRWIRCYDNGGSFADRYTVCFTGRAGVDRTPGFPAEYCYRAMSENPRDPQGVGLWCSTQNRPADVVGKAWGGPALGRKCHLGTRIRFQDLPAACQELVLDDYCEIWRLPLPDRSKSTT